MFFCEYISKITESIARFAVKWQKGTWKLTWLITASILASPWKETDRACSSQGSKPWHLLAIVEIVLFIPILKRFVRIFLKALNLERYHAMESGVLSSSAVLHPLFMEMICCKARWCVSVVWFGKLNIKSTWEIMLQWNWIKLLKFVGFFWEFSYAIITIQGERNSNVDSNRNKSTVNKHWCFGHIPFRI